MKAEIESEMVWNGKTWEIFLADVIVEINLSSLLPFKNERDFLTRFKDAITIGIQAENVCVMSAKKYPCILSHQTGASVHTIICHAWQ